MQIWIWFPICPILLKQDKWAHIIDFGNRYVSKNKGSLRVSTMIQRAKLLMWEFIYVWMVIDLIVV